MFFIFLIFFSLKYKYSFFFNSRYIYTKINENKKNMKRKRIIRLSESQLTKLVKRVVNEATVSAQDAAEIKKGTAAGNAWVDCSIASKIYDSQGYIWDDLNMLADALAEIKDKAQYYRVEKCLSAVSDGDYDDIIDYINNFAEGFELVRAGVDNELERVVGASEASRLNDESTWSDKLNSPH